MAKTARLIVIVSDENGDHYKNMEIDYDDMKRALRSMPMINDGGTAQNIKPPKYGDIKMNSTKVAQVNFNESFDKEPHITATLRDRSSSPAHVVSVTKDYFRIKFTNAYNGIIDWRAEEK